MRNLKTALLSFLILSSVFTMVGCQNNVPGRFLTACGWLPDNSKIIAYIYDNEMPNTGYEIITFLPSGEEVKRIEISTPLLINHYSDQLYFTEDGIKFFANIDSSLYLIDSGNGSQTLIATGCTFIMSSPSGKIAFVKNTFSSNDTTHYSLIFLNGSKVDKISTFSIPNSATFYPEDQYTAFRFVNDSLMVGCFSDTSFCSLTFFDTGFNVLYTLNNHEVTSLISNSSIMGDVIYESNANLYKVNAKDQVVTVIKPVQSRLTSLSFAANGSFLIYTYNPDMRYFFQPNTLIYYDLLSKQERVLAENIASSAQLSRDGKSIAFFSDNNYNVQLRVIPVQ